MIDEAIFEGIYVYDLIGLMKGYSSSVSEAIGMLIVYPASRHRRSSFIESGVYGYLW